ncbi:hypothetical protein ABTF16_23005, partial [Acinetobacter baumannii]
KQKLKEEIREAVIRSGVATEADVPNIILETPKDKAHGDYSTNVAMQLARVAKKAPRMIAEDIVRHFNGEAVFVKKVDIAGPGFINFYM